MYIDEAIPDLVRSLTAVATSRQGGTAGCSGSSGSGGPVGAAVGTEEGLATNHQARPITTRGSTQILIAHGRNRGAEPVFLRRCQGLFRVDEVSSDELDPLYQCSDVDVLRLTLV